MPHLRQQIRDAVAARVTGLTTTQARVYLGRTRPLEQDHLPALFVFTRQEISRLLSLGRPRTTLRIVDLKVEGRVQLAAQGAGVDTAQACEDLLEDIALEVERKMFGEDTTFGRLVKDLVLTGTVKTVTAAGDRHEGSMLLSFDVSYATREAAPDSAV